MAVEIASIELGFKAPDFTLLNTATDTEVSLADLQSDKATVIMFICNHCPYVKHVDSGMRELANDYQSQGVSIIAISSNDVVNYPEDSPEKMSSDPLE